MVLRSQKTPYPIDLVRGKFTERFPRWVGQISLWHLASILSSEDSSTTSCGSEDGETPSEEVILREISNRPMWFQKNNSAQVVPLENKSTEDIHNFNWGQGVKRGMRSLLKVYHTSTAEKCFLLPLLPPNFISIKSLPIKNNSAPLLPHFWIEKSLPPLSTIHSAAFIRFYKASVTFI